ncbi:hypothetical protein PTSG_06818 [Salpingoeca rosetta]|uniref:Palmitoyltransferase n=1 Tax=Salpingoeca rosetta (strain ATCC 50818 / BSB-021) TaxID=946362 RepID=F2UEW5_SALR5|nr:uncharacterized protein PTSG_06818 [Salpingoeca rosetta]EGD75165.1 hypothetical protein PTSG_06818 [Salpingoeca rosetta]|eukprot:XP_004992218.1 hypothetical protein PTSG_06818 [Salpingoeca rosetta]
MQPKYCSVCGSTLQDGKACHVCGHILTPDDPPVYEYELHPGNNLFPCWGRCITAKDQSVVSFTWMAFFVVFGVFLGLTAPYVWTHLTPALVIAPCILAVWSAASLLMTQCTDPGIVPRGEQCEILQPDEELMGFAMSNAFSHKKVNVNGVEVTVKYCSTCRTFRAPRVSHCRACNNCVEEFDHHCPATASAQETTGGARVICQRQTALRPSYFFSFVWTMLLLLGTVCAACIWHLIDVSKVKGSNNDKSAFVQAPASVFVAIFTGMFLLSVSSLAFYHLSLVIRNVTTNEDIRSRFTRNPHARNCWLNVCSRLCGPRMPSRLFLRRRLDPSLAPFNRPFLPPPQPNTQSTVAAAPAHGFTLHDPPISNPANTTTTTTNNTDGSIVSSLRSHTTATSPTPSTPLQAGIAHPHPRHVDVSPAPQGTHAHVSGQAGELLASIPSVGEAITLSEHDDDDDDDDDVRNDGEEKGKVDAERRRQLEATQQQAMGRVHSTHSASSPATGTPSLRPATSSATGGVVDSSYSNGGAVVAVVDDVRSDDEDVSSPLLLEHPDDAA